MDLGGTTAKIGLFKKEGFLIRKWEIPTRKEDGGKHVSPDIAASIRKAMAEEGIPMEALAGAGIGVPGPILPDGYVEIIVNIGMRDWNPVKELSELLGGIPVKGANDANIAALGEMWQGGGKGHKDVVAITLGTGVGGGVIVTAVLCREATAWAAKWATWSWTGSGRSRRPATAGITAAWSRSPRPRDRADRQAVHEKTGHALRSQEGGSADGQGRVRRGKSGG